MTDADTDIRDTTATLNTRFCNRIGATLLLAEH